MWRTVLAVIAAFFAWLIAWVGGEQILSMMSPEGYGVEQRAFQAAIESGAEFTASTTLLVIQLALGSVVSLASGFLATVIARGNKRVPLILGLLLLALGVLKAVLSWPYVPVWSHVIFTAVLLPMTMLGGRLRRSEARGPR